MLEVALSTLNCAWWVEYWHLKIEAYVIALKVKEVCAGVKYLHSLDPPIVHGDLKGVSNMISTI